MKKSLLAPVLILSLWSSSMGSPVESDSKNATRSTVADPLPKGWRIEKIAKAAHPSALPRSTHVLAWTRMQDDRPLHAEGCLVLCRLPDGSSRDRWLLVHLVRVAKKEQWSGWKVTTVYRTNGETVVCRRGYKNRLSNKEIYGFADKVRWCFGAHEGFKLLGGAVCKNTWETVVKEKPTRAFKK